MSQKSLDSFNTAAELKVGNRSYKIFRLDRLEKAGFRNAARLPVSLKVLLENLLRNEDNRLVTMADIDALAGWNPKVRKEKEIAFMPAGGLTPDLAGLSCVAALARGG